MSRVFVAEETRFHRRVVIKVLSPELAVSLSADRFEREIRVAAGLQQPNIVPLITAGDTGGLPWYSMPFVEGESLRARIERGTLPVAESIAILRDVARALAYAHARGVVHRDIKPENVLLHEGSAVVIDFGIAVALSASKTEQPAGRLTLSGTSIGTPAYMAPEQAAADPATDHRADIYAWGIMAYELFAGAHPFAAKSSPKQLMAAHFSETPVALATRATSLPPALADLVTRSLAKDPADRPQAASELLSVLDRGLLSGANGATAAPRRSRVRWLVATISGLVTVVAIGLWLLLRSDSVVAPRSMAVVPSPEKSLAVLPFESLGGDTANVYFAEGMADELSTALARIKGLRVAATSSSFTYRNKTADPKEVGRALNVTAVLQGRMRRAGSQLHLTVQLTSAADGSILWGDSYDRELKDVFAVQDALTRDIVRELRVTLVGGPATAARGERAGTTNIEAYDLYLRGVNFLQKRGGGVARSIGYFKQAIAKDSLFARAWAQLGTAYALLPYYTLGSADSARRQARDASNIALRLDPSSAESHAASGMAYMLGNRWDNALAEFERAITLDPDYTVSYRASMPALYMLGRSDDAVARGAVAAKLDPLAPTTFALYSLALLNANRRGDALVAARRAVELDSLNSLAQAELGVAEYLAGNTDRAVAVARRVAREPHTSLWIGFVRAATGDRAGATALISDLEHERGRNVQAESAIAWTYLGAGDTTRALDALERAAKAGEPIAFVSPFGHPAYDVVRQSARFAAIMRAFGVDPSRFTAPPTVRAR